MSNNEKILLANKFKSELKALMEKYNVEIVVSNSEEVGHDPEISFDFLKPNSLQTSFELSERWYNSISHSDIKI